MHYRPLCIFTNTILHVAVQIFIFRLCWFTSLFVLYLVPTKTLTRMYPDFLGTSRTSCLVDFQNRRFLFTVMAENKVKLVYSKSARQWGHKPLATVGRGHLVSIRLYIQQQRLHTKSIKTLEVQISHVSTTPQSIS